MAGTSTQKWSEVCIRSAKWHCSECHFTDTYRPKSENSKGSGSRQDCALEVQNRKLYLNVTLGNSLILNCTVRYCIQDAVSSYPVTTWVKVVGHNFFQLEKTKDKHVEQQQQSRDTKEDKIVVFALKIYNVTPEDKGVYRCRAVQNSSIAMGHSIHIAITNSTIVSPEPSVDELHPDSSLRLNSVNIVIIFFCSVLLLLIFFLLLQYCTRECRGKTNLIYPQQDEVKDVPEVTYASVVHEGAILPQLQYRHIYMNENVPEYATVVCSSNPREDKECKTNNSNQQQAAVSASQGHLTT
ncbi:B- and T-lymphocyte attenuator-like [Protopterus annectens]|uniref:B- and T-lymphocyte attenuator-like n=1 Tax=Protopterus annectens TaxID=7888 RepID=UPI001CFB9EC0|nr:B- and T-lymphocyte attenuator-like [Protopterus annectens]